MTASPSPADAAQPAPMDLPRPLVLGSTSVYRQALLRRLRLPFSVAASAVDETPQPGEPAAALAQRLALAKARAVSQAHPKALVIGADQTAEALGDAGQPVPAALRLIGKPGDLAGARAQLTAMSGRALRFHSAVALVCAATGHEAQGCATITVQMRALSTAGIERYLSLDEPYDCAGSAKVESLGIALAERIDSDDPTALEGLPLILTCRLLRGAGLDPLGWAR